MTTVHQFVPALLPRDATGGHTLALRDTFRQAGWTSDIYVEAAHDELLAEATYFERYPADARPGDILLYQAGTGSPVADFLLDRPETLVLDYHNITPAHFFEGWEEHTAEKVSLARMQVARLAARAALGIADSAFNAAELRNFGCQATRVVPILTDIESWAGRHQPDHGEVARRSQAHRTGTILLFVGRLSPNKNQHLLVETLWFYREWYDPEARLVLVGPAITGAYAEAVVGIAAELGMARAVEHGENLTPAQLAARYAEADAFVCLSDHEGFCIPLLEAMYFDLPIVAFAAGAVPETLGPAGIVLDSKRPTVVAAAIHRVLGDAALVEHLAREGQRRLGAFGPAKTRARFIEVVGELAAAGVGTA
ncbi:MAG: glycosyltransferase family 4 protein [Acidimicrobiales bacterium]